MCVFGIINVTLDDDDDDDDACKLLLLLLLLLQVTLEVLSSVVGNTV